MLIGGGKVLNQHAESPEIQLRFRSIVYGPIRDKPLFGSHFDSAGCLMMLLRFWWLDARLAKELAPGGSQWSLAAEAGHHLLWKQSA